MDIDSFIQAVEALDEEELTREIADLREEQRRVTIELSKRLDALEVKRRWEQQKQPGGSPELPAFGAARDVRERIRAHSAPQAANGTDPASPRGTEAVRRVMKEGGVWTAKRLHAELERRGWVNPGTQHPAKATETALGRLHGKYGEVERVERGQYRYKRPPQPVPDSLLDPDPGSAEP